MIVNLCDDSSVLAPGVQAVNQVLKKQKSNYLIGDKNKSNKLDKLIEKDFKKPVLEEFNRFLDANNNSPANLLEAKIPNLEIIPENIINEIKINLGMVTSQIVKQIDAFVLKPKQKSKSKKKGKLSNQYVYFDRYKIIPKEFSFLNKILDQLNISRYFYLTMRDWTIIQALHLPVAIGAGVAISVLIAIFSPILLPLTLITITFLAAAFVVALFVFPITFVITGLAAVVISVLGAFLAGFLWAALPAVGGGIAGFVIGLFVLSGLIVITIPIGGIGIWVDLGAAIIGALIGFSALGFSVYWISMLATLATFLLISLIIVPFLTLFISIVASGIIAVLLTLFFSPILLVLFLVMILPVFTFFVVVVPVILVLIVQFVGKPKLVKKAPKSKSKSKSKSKKKKKQKRSNPLAAFGSLSSSYLGIPQKKATAVINGGTISFPFNILSIKNKLTIKRIVVADPDSDDALVCSPNGTGVTCKPLSQNEEQKIDNSIQEMNQETQPAANNQQSSDKNQENKPDKKKEKPEKKKKKIYPTANTGLINRVEFYIKENMKAGHPNDFLNLIENLYGTKKHPGSIRPLLELMAFLVD